jgi:hypothetical protein
MVAEKQSLLLPKLDLAAMCQQVEKFGNDPASERVSSVEGVEGNISVCIARLSIRSEYHFISGTKPS